MYMYNVLFVLEKVFDLYMYVSMTPCQKIKGF